MSSQNEAGPYRCCNVLDGMRGTSSFVLLDIKSSGVIDNVMKVIQNADAGRIAGIASFDRSPLIRSKELYPEIPTTLIVGASRVMASPAGFIRSVFALLFPIYAATRIRANSILCPAHRLSHRLVKSAHQKQIEVFVWKLKNHYERGVLDFDVKGLIVDGPVSTIFSKVHMSVP